MNGEHEPQEVHPGAPPSAVAPKSASAIASEPRPIDPAPPRPTTTQQFQEVKERMTAFEKSTVRWTRVAVGVSILAAIFVCAQWWEMHEGGKDTHDLAVAAGNQATWTQRLADSAKIQSDKTQALADRTKDLADRMKDQADQTKAMAGQAIIQANAAREVLRRRQKTPCMCRSEPTWYSEPLLTISQTRESRSPSLTAGTFLPGLRRSSSTRRHLDRMIRRNKSSDPETLLSSMRTWIIIKLYPLCRLGALPP